MGGQCSGQHNDAELRYKKLTVVTLSYCGLTSSPFQFYINEYEHQLERIGDYFQQLIRQELNDFTDKKKGKDMFGPIELKFKKRYSPMFDKMAGIVKIEGAESQYKKYRFVDKQEFYKLWDKKFNWYYQNEPQFKKLLDKMKQEDNKKLPIQKQNVKTYDFLMFKALLRYVYKQKDFNKVITENPNKYLNIISPLFEFSFLDQANKLSKFQYGFRKTNPDVFFLQQTTKELSQFLNKRAKRNYRWIGDEHGQLIIIKDESFPGQEFEVVDIEQTFKVKGESSSTGFKPIGLGTKSKNFLFISLHFSSREDVNSKQIKYLQNLLQQISKSKLYKSVILGGNLNKFINKFTQGFDFYPKKPTEITTFKKRTKTQGQMLKNDVRDKRSLDKIITNQTLLQGEITLIDGTKPDEFTDDKIKKEDENDPKFIQEKEKCQQGLNSKIKMMLPCDIHPFDKFLVKTTIQVPNYKQVAFINQSI